MTPALAARNACGLAQRTFLKWFLGMAAKQVKLLPLPGLKIALAANVAKRLAQRISLAFGFTLVLKPLEAWV
jgi:hypothetical protein